jgi:hypothetical protein
LFFEKSLFACDSAHLKEKASQYSPSYSHGANMGGLVIVFILFFFLKHCRRGLQWGIIRNTHNKTLKLNDHRVNNAILVLCHQWGKE